MDETLEENVEEANNNEVSIDYINSILDENIEGFYVKNLDKACILIDKISLLHSDLDKREFRTLLYKFFSIASKPLIETKTNERLSAEGYEKIIQYISRLSIFFYELDSFDKIKLTECLISISEVGAPINKESPSSSLSGKKKIIDVGFILKAIKESGIINDIVSEFISVSYAIYYKEQDIQAEEVLENNNPELYDAEFYGVPKDFGKPVPPEEESTPSEEPLLIDPLADLIPGDIPESVFSPYEDMRKELDQREKAIKEVNVETVFAFDTLDEGKKVKIEQIKSPKQWNFNNPSSIAFDNSEQPEQIKQIEQTNEAKDIEPTTHSELSLSKIVSNSDIEQQPQESGEASQSAKKLSEVNKQHGSFSKSFFIRESPSTYRQLSQNFLDLCLNLAQDPDIAFQMCQLKLGEALLTMLDKDFEFNHRDRRISYTLELLWNILESYLLNIKKFAGNADSLDDSVNGLAKRSKMPAASPTKIDSNDYLNDYDGIFSLEYAINILLKLLEYYLLNGYSQTDKELRNEVLIVVTMLAQFPSSASHIFESGLLRFLLTYACIEEVGPDECDMYVPEVAGIRNFGSTSDIDLEFKKELWFILSEVIKSNHFASINMIASSPLIYCVLLTLEKDSFDYNKRAGQLSTRNNAYSSSQSHPHEMGINSMLPGEENGYVNMSKFEPSVSQDPTAHLPSETGRPGNFLLSIDSTTSPMNIEGGPLATKRRLPVTKQQYRSYSQSLLPQPLEQQEEEEGNQPLLRPDPSSKNPTVALDFRSSSSVDSRAAERLGGVIHTLPLSKIREFQQLAISFLIHSIPKFIDDFEHLDGIARIINIIMIYSSSQAQEHKTLVFHCLVLLNRCMLISPSVRLFIEHQNLIDTFLDIYLSIESDDTKSQILRIVSLLCMDDNEYCQKQFRDLHGISHIIAPLVQYTSKRAPLVGRKANIKISIDKSFNNLSNPLENPFGGDISILILSILESINYTIVGNAINEFQFAEKEGLDVLMELLEVSPFVLRIKVLRVLNNLLLNKHLSVYVNAWKSPKTLRSSAQIFTHAWMDEEARIVQEKRPNGIIENLNRPLGHVQIDNGIDSEPISGANASSQNGSHISRDPVVAYPNEKSLTVTKLATAILAGRNANQTNLPVEVCSQVLERDIRGLLANTFMLLGLIGSFNLYMEKYNTNYKSIFTAQGGMDPETDEANTLMASQKVKPETTGFFEEASGSLDGFKSFKLDPSKHEDEKSIGEEALPDNNPNIMIQPQDPSEEAYGIELDPSDRQVLSLAKYYHAMREGEWWQEVQSFTESQGIDPIDADKYLMDSRLMFAYSSAESVRNDQQILFQEGQTNKRIGEEQFIEQILTKKHQQIKAEWLRKYGKANAQKNNRTKKTKPIE